MSPAGRERLGFGAPRRHFRRVESTNDVARALAVEGASSGTIVTADEQTAGRGRHDRRWIAPPGTALLYSAILRPLESSDGLLPLAVPIAVCEVAEQLGASQCQIKWPNDVWLEERKLAGVLIEARPREGWAVIGVGLNVRLDPNHLPEELQSRAASLGETASVDAARALLNRSLTVWVNAENDRVLDEFRRRDALRGKEISWAEGSGIAEGVDREGRLLVRSGEERVALGAGEIHLQVRSAR
jgi:BirA family biotin operon repressor/biotin-[acetyl-CoA-carboxylase] ligase